MLAKLFNSIFGTRTKRFYEPAEAETFTVAQKPILSGRLSQVFPPSYPALWVPERESIEFIDLCRAGNLALVAEMLDRHPSLINATVYRPAGGHLGSMTAHSGDGIDCMNAVQASVVAGHNEILRLLISHGAKVPCDSIRRAAADGNIEALQAMLLPMKSELVARELEPTAAITEALVLACRSGHREAANFLLDNGALLEGTKGYYASGNPLYSAMMSSNTQLVRDLLERGADVNAHEVRGCENYRDVNQDALSFVKSARHVVRAETGRHFLSANPQP